MNKEELDNLIRVFKFYPEIKLVYFFGSKARKDSGPLSDYDLAFYLDEKDKKKIFDIKFKLHDEISRLFKTDKVDIIMLNITESPELKYNIIKEGKLIYEKEPFRIMIEPKILNEYFDFHDLLLKYNLTKA
ncbi:MAG: nucleotidyltransferase domain-containing protein [Patescibacteria group bacterium]